MKLIQHNPYRIIGILANANIKELEKQKSKIKAFTKVGKTIKSDYDFTFFDDVDRNEDVINQAFSQIEQNEDRVNNALFWFINTKHFDNTAIEYLKNGDNEKALEIWEKVTTDNDVNSRNFSAFNNLGTYNFLSKDKTDIKAGIEAKIKLIESDYFKNFVHTVADETYTIDHQKQIEKFIDLLLYELNSRYSNTEILQLFDECDDIVQKYLSNKLTEEPLNRIENQIDSCKNKRKGNKSKAYTFGLNLYTNTKNDLSLLKSLLGTNNLKYKAIADRLANEILQCGIDYFNELQESDSSENYLESAQKLTKLAEPIAVGNITRDRIKENLASLENMKDREINQVIALLQSVKDAYETKEQNARQEVESLLKSKNSSILSEIATKSAIKDIAKNSIDWDKVNDLLREILPDKNLKIIKHNANNELKSEFIELAYWLQEYSQNNSLISRIIKKYKRIPPKLSFRIVSSEIMNNNKPLYTKFIRYISLSLNLDVTSDMSVTFYLKYIKPNGRLNRNSKSSPKRYTLSETETITKQTNKVILSGWGNSEECTYDIGEHRIEVYVDDYLIHTKKYTVDIAPSERLEKEIAHAEKTLREIKQTNYYESEIRFAQDEMKEIQKFKLFRRKSKKQTQIQTQQDKIDKLIEKSKNEKKKNIRSQEEKIYKLKMELSNTKY